MVIFNLKDKVEEYYGSRHYLFMVAKANNFSLPVSWRYGDVIKLPARGNRRCLVNAEYRRRTMTFDPTGG
jgi:hypothetical protein